MSHHRESPLINCQAIFITFRLSDFLYPAFRAPCFLSTSMHDIFGSQQSPSSVDWQVPQVVSAGERDCCLSDHKSCLKIGSKLSQNCPKVGSKLSQRAAGCVRTQEGDYCLPDLASRAAAGQCYRCQSATAATNTVLQVLRCYSRVLTRCKDATAEY